MRGMNVLACCRCARFLPAMLVFAVGTISTRAADNVIALKAARMFDGKSNTLVKNGVVVVQGDKIADVGSNLAIPSDAQVIDLGNATLAPGFMDAHTHLTTDYSGDYNLRRLKEVDFNVSEQAIIASAYARSTVEAGFTTVRDLGSRFVGSASSSKSPCAIQSIKESSLVRACWLPPKESLQPVVTSIRPADSAIFFLDANRIIPTALRMARMKSGKLCDLR